MPLCDGLPSAERPDYRRAARLLRTHVPSGSVLDVGCAGGAFLAGLPSAYARYGVEPSEEAGAVARQRGVALLGRSLREASSSGARFHAITLLNVIEHLPSPLEHLAIAADMLLPGGLLVISTGNTDALPWRLMRTSYWYYYPQHVTFYNPKWFRFAARRLDMQCVSVERFCYYGGVLPAVLEKLAKLRAPRPRSTQGKRPTEPLSTRLWPDHIMVALGKKL